MDANGTVTAVGIGEATITATTEDGGYSASCDVLTADVCGENVIWTLDDAGTLTILGTGAMNDYSSDSDALWYNIRKSIKSVVIESGVTSIGEWVFIGCTSLERIDVEENNAEYSSADGILFNKGKTTLIAYPAGKSQVEYEIPDSVTRIGAYAFNWCESLVDITIPDSVTSIGGRAFEECPGITIHGYARSSAEQYANSNGINFAVIRVDVESVSLDKTKISLYLGESEELVVRINPPLATNINTLWSSTDESVATVDENGIVTAVGAGSASIIAMSVSGNKSVSCTVTVTEPVAFIPGDANGDETVDFVDAMLVLKHDAGVSELSGDALAAADANGDGNVDFVDAIMILKYDAGLIEEMK